MESKSFAPDILAELRDRAEVRIETEDDGKRSSVIIWVVVTREGGVYVRSYRGPKGKWYQRTRRDGQAGLRVGRRTLRVRAEPDSDSELNRRVDDAFNEKYGSRWPKETEAMVKPASVRRTTLRLTPLHP
jgi:hypothetical protein